MKCQITATRAEAIQVAEFEGLKQAGVTSCEPQAELHDKFEIEGFPTLILLDADGKVLRKHLGYDGAKPGEIIGGLGKGAEGRVSCIRQCC